MAVIALIAVLVFGPERLPEFARQAGRFLHRMRQFATATRDDLRTELGPDEGMIFPSTPPSARSFWMKNTPLPLDIIFIGVDGRILNVAAMTTPYSLESIASSGITRGVLELAGGRAAELGIEPGDLVDW